MAAPEYVRSARQRYNVLVRHHGREAPVTVEALRALLLAKAQAADAEAARLRDLRALLDPVAVTS